MMPHRESHGSPKRLTLPAVLAMDDPTDTPAAGPRPAHSALALAIRHADGSQQQHDRQRNILHPMLLRFS
jgi:hypothetical protein